MKKKRFISILLSLVVVTTFTACGTNNENTVGYLSNNQKDYMARLEDGVYYVRAKDTNECKPIYFGEATFEKDSIINSPDNGRIAWFKADFDKIPTLYEGDSLIYFTKSLLDEKMTFERFKDLGYTIGICGMEKLKSGRYAIYTDVEKKCTYPEGDTDEILKLTNKTVTLDTIGGVDVRAPKDEDSNETFLSEHGTILGLEKDGSYEVSIYDGTVEHKYNFTANVKALGSFEVEENYDYDFESQYLINIPIPETFNTGYYMINGAGIFRYVKGSSFDESTNFNIPNIYKDSNFEDDNNPSSIVSPSPNDTEPDYQEMPDGVTSSFEVSSAGTISVEIAFTIPGSTEYVDPSGVTALITKPDGGTLMMLIDSDAGVIHRTFDAMEGEYIIEYYDLDNKEPHVEVSVE